MQHPAMSPLLNLPHELLQRICCDVGPQDVGRLAESCRTLHRFIDGNRLLFKEIYLKHFDRPDDENVDWIKKLESVIRVVQILSSEDLDVKASNIIDVADTVEQLLTKSEPWYGKGESKNLKRLQELFQSDANKKGLLCRSTLLGRARKSDEILARPLAERQASAKLHCLFGVPIDVPSHLRSEDYPVMTNTFARSKVYDLREYTDRTFWGPFMNDGSGDVDWEKVESVLIDLNYNMMVFSDRTSGTFVPAWRKPFHGLSKDSFKAKSILPTPLEPPVDSRDPYNISGTWFRVVCFLDYGDLYEFNFGPEQPSRTESRPELDTEEAIRLIHMVLEVTDISEPGEHDGKDLPVVHFNGHCRSLHAAWDPNANSDIRGSVRLTPQGYIRWTTFSVYHGEERWRSEGIQLGGLRSSRGVLGNWFDKDYSDHGPAGPTAFWKLKNGLTSRRPPLVA